MVITKVIQSKAVRKWAIATCLSVEKMLLNVIPHRSKVIAVICERWGKKTCLKVFFFFLIARATISVSLVHQRRQTLTGCFVVSWELFMCSAKLSTLLRSLLFTNWAQDTR